MSEKSKPTTVSGTIQLPAIPMQQPRLSSTGKTVVVGGTNPGVPVQLPDGQWGTLRATITAPRDAYPDALPAKTKAK